MARFTRYARGGSNKDSIRAIEGIVSDYKRFVGVVNSEAERILERAGEIVLDYVIPRVPVETGALLESGRTYVVRQQKGPSAIVTFGGEHNPVAPTKNAPDGIVFYALMVHEDEKRDEETGYKFLELGALDAMPEVNDYIISELKKIKP